MGWKQLHIMQEHDQRVTGIDWAPKTNRIVTCAADKNAFVWTQDEDGKWNPAWVLLRTNRAATCVKWSPLGIFHIFLVICAITAIRKRVSRIMSDIMKI